MSGLDPKYLPFEVNHFDNDISYEEAFFIEAERIENLSKFVTTCLRLCASEDEKWQQERVLVRTSIVSKVEIKTKIQKLYDIWLEHLVEYYVALHEIKDYEMEDELDPVTFKPRRFKHATAMQIFTELTRLFYLKERPMLLFEDESARLCDMKDLSWVKIVRSFDITDQYEEKEDKDDEVETKLTQIKAMWEKPILEYTQSEIMCIILFLVQQLNEVQETCMDEYQLVFNTVWIRIAQFIIHLHPRGVLEENKNNLEESEPQMSVKVNEEFYTVHRNFYMFITIYMTPIIRRFFYQTMFQKLTKPKEIGFIDQATVRKWVEDIINGFAEEAFNDLYVEHCTEAYTFPGDAIWYKYMYPTKIASIPAYLAKMRPHLYRRFFSESQASKKSVLAAVDTSFIARFFVLKAISAYIQIKTGINEVKFYDACAIQSMELNFSYYTMTANRCPLIIQAFSTYWAYDDKCFWPSDNVYETIGAWFYLLRVRYESKLHGFSLKRFFVELEPPQVLASREDQEGNQEIDNVFSNLFIDEGEKNTNFLI